TAAAPPPARGARSRLRKPIASPRTRKPAPTPPRISHGNAPASAPFPPLPAGGLASAVFGWGLPGFWAAGAGAPGGNEGREGAGRVQPGRYGVRAGRASSVSTVQ